MIEAEIVEHKSKIALDALSDPELAELLGDVLDEIRKRPYPFRTKVQAAMDWIARNRQMAQITFKNTHWEAFWKGAGSYRRGGK